MCMFLCRSTVEFAREVSEAKAMDDTVNRLEQMLTGGGDSPISAPRRGTSPASKTINWGDGNKQNPTVVRECVHVATRQRDAHTYMYMYIYPV